MSVWSIPFFPANLAIYEESYIFGRPKRSFGRPWRPNAIWCDMKFSAHHFFGSLRIFCQDAHFWGGGGLHILSCDRAQLELSLARSKMLRVAYILVDIKIGTACASL